MKPRARLSIVPLTIVSLLNIPVAFSSGSEYLSEPIRWTVSLLGVVGIVSGIALLARRHWAHPVVVGVALANIIAGVGVLAFGHGEGVVGTVLGLAVMTFAARRTSPVASYGPADADIITSAP